MEMRGIVVKAQKMSDDRLLDLEEKRMEMEERQLEREAQQRREDRRFMLDMMSMMMGHQTSPSPYHTLGGVYNSYPQPFDNDQ